MTTFTAWLRQQLRQERLNCRTLARRCGLTATQIRLAVAQAAPPSAHAERELVCALYVMPPARVRQFNRALTAAQG